MSLRPVDLAIEARWMLTAREGEPLLEHHTLIVHEGRIVEVLPTAAVPERYRPLVTVVRPAHLLLPGLVHARVSFDAAARTAARHPEDAVLLGLAQLLRAGVTTFAHVGALPRTVAQLALEQGLRLCLGVPIAAGAGASLTEALELHDRYRAHPAIVTRFALPDISTLDDALLTRLAAVSLEIEAGILAPLHATAREIATSVQRFGVRPLARLERHALLSPSFAAAHLTHLDAGDLELARRNAIAVTLCPQADALAGEGCAPLAALRAANLALSLGRDGPIGARHPSPWGDIASLVLTAPDLFGPAQALEVATREAAKALACEDRGMLAADLSADLACFPCDGADALAGSDPLEGLVLGDAAHQASDVWVAGRQLICEGVFTRLDWARLSARLAASGE